MSHVAGLLIVSLATAAVFALISKQQRQEQIRYFLKVLGYMAVGSFVAAWVMSLIPW